MAGPWDKYKTAAPAASAGPWQKYKTAAPDAAPAPAAPQQPDFIDAAMRSNPLTSGIDAGLNAVGTTPTRVVQQGLSGVNTGLAHTVDLPKLALSIGPAIANLFGAHVQGPDYIPNFGDAITQKMSDVGMVTPPSSNFVDRLARSSGEAIGASALPEAGLTARAGGTLMDFIRGLGAAATSGAGGEVARTVAPGNAGAEVAGELLGGVVPSTAMSTMRALTAPKALTATGEAVPGKLVAAVQRDQIPLDQVPQRVADLGPAGTVADLGDNTQKLAAGIASQPGEPGATISNAMKARSKDSVNRVPAAVNDTLGPATPPSSITADIAANKKAVGPEYDTVLANAGPVDPAPLAASIDGLIATKKGPAQAALRQVRDMLNANGTDTLDTTASGLFETRNAIDGMITPSGDTKVNGALKDVRKQIDALLETAAPGIKEVDAKYRELSRQGDALDAGGQVLDGGKSAVWPVDNAKAVAEGVQPQGALVGPSAATFRLSQGARADIERIVGTKTNDRVALANIIQGESDWNPQKLAQLFGQDKADRIMQIVQNERRMAETENLAVNGSKTAAVTAAQQDLGANPVAPITNVVRAGGWSGQNAAFHLAANVMDAIASGAVGKRNQNIADVIMGQGDWTVPQRQPFFSPQQRDAMLAAVFGSAANGAGQ